MSSVNNQTGIDFNQVEVILVSDGGRFVDVDQQFSYMKCQIKFCQNEINGGAGVARQMGMDAAEGNYYMFIDADDQLQNCNALEPFFNVVEYNGDRDIITSRYIEQVPDEDAGFRYLTHQSKNWTSPVAKWFNRDFINRIGLRWLDDLRVFEDTYFVGLACELAGSIYYSEAITYMWQSNPQSTMRQRNGDFSNQLHVWSRMNHAYLDMIKIHRPKILFTTYSDYVADIFLRTQKYEAADSQAFTAEHEALMREYCDLWPELRPRLRKIVSNLVSTSNEFKGSSTLHLHRFIKQQDQITKL